MLNSKKANAKPKEVVVEQAPPQPPPPSFVLLFQMEEILVNSRKTMFDVLKKQLGEYKITLTQGVFSRFSLSFSPASFLPAMIDALGGGRKIPVEKLVGEVTDKWSSHLSGSTAALPPALLKMLKLAKEHNVAAGMVSELDEATSQTIMGKLDLAELDVKLFNYKDGDKVFPGPDTWLKTAKAMNQNPRSCAVLAGSMIACKSALSADMRCVVIPDEFTAFQDYGGADLVLESFEELTPKEILAKLFPKLT